MGTMRRVAMGMALGTTVLAAVPAAADWNRAPDRHHHRDTKVKAGDVLIGAAVIGLIAAVASKKAKPAPYDAPPPDAPPPAFDAPPGDPVEAEAVDRCVQYVGENYADDYDRFARVEEISSVEPTAKGFKVRGRVRIVDYRGGDRLAKFRCSINRSGSSRSLTVS